VPRALFRFYEELNDLLPPGRQKVPFEVAFKGRPAIKDTIESLGVPHTEVDLILVNGCPVDFGHILADGDRVSVYPVFESLDIQGVSRLRARPLRRTRFLAADNLGRLVRYLRALGLDVAVAAGLSEAETIARARTEQRILLTASRDMLKRREVSHGVLVRPGPLASQVRAILARLDLWNDLVPFSRCLLCNVLLEPMSPEAAAGRVPPRVRAAHTRFAHCPACGRVFWKGSHHAALRRFISALRAD